MVLYRNIIHIAYSIRFLRCWIQVVSQDIPQAVDELHATLLDLYDLLVLPTY